MIKKKTTNNNSVKGWYPCQTADHCKILPKLIVQKLHRHRDRSNPGFKRRFETLQKESSSPKRCSLKKIIIYHALEIKQNLMLLIKASNNQQVWRKWEGKIALWWVAYCICECIDLALRMSFSHYRKMWFITGKQSDTSIWEILKSKIWKPSFKKKKMTGMGGGEVPKKTL